MTPGTRVVFNQNCAWPERIGCEGVIVDPAIFKGKYPADKRSMRDGDMAIVLLDDDPLDRNPNRSWSCVTEVADLDVVAELAKDEG